MAVPPNPLTVGKQQAVGTVSVVKVALLGGWMGGFEGKLLCGGSFKLLSGCSLLLN